MVKYKKTLLRLLRDRERTGGKNDHNRNYNGVSALDVPRVGTASICSGIHHVSDHDG